MQLHENVQQVSFAVVKEEEGSLVEEISDRYHFSQDKDVSEGMAYSRYHYEGCYHGNKRLKNNQHDHYSTRHQKRKNEVIILQCELRKLKSPTFTSENSNEVAEMWLQEMKKYMRLHGYSDNREAHITIFNL